MRRITHDEVLREIWEGSTELFVSFLADGKNQAKYSFDRFRRDMMRHDLLVDNRTIKSKWDSLIAKGVIRETGKRYTDSALNIWALAPYMGTDTARQLLIETGREPVGYGVNPWGERHTHIEEVA